MEFTDTILFSPITAFVVGSILAIIFIASPFDIKFDDQEEIEI
jgi:hypothetical protein